MCSLLAQPSFAPVRGLAPPAEACSLCGRPAPSCTSLPSMAAQSVVGIEWWLSFTGGRGELFWMSWDNAVAINMTLGTQRPGLKFQLFHVPPQQMTLRLSASVSSLIKWE